MSNFEETRNLRGDAPARRHVRLPGFITEQSTGLGDLVKKVTYSVGVKPCAGCEQRASAMNRWLRFGPKR